MEIEFRLKQLLVQHGLDSHGIIQRIAAQAHLHRHTVRKMYWNKLQRPSLATIGAVAKWLEDNGVPAKDLPQVLLGRRPAELWKAVTAPGHVAIYVGEYEQVDQPVGPGRWISTHDAEVAAQLVRELSATGHTVGERPEVRLIYVPFRFSASARDLLQKPLATDIARIQVLYEQMMSPAARETAILVGSMRVNYLVEFVVADLFGCKPFETPRTPRVPFWLTYRPTKWAVASCFGGPKNPPALGADTAPGIYYLEDEKAGRWAFCGWSEAETDAGIVVTVRDPGTNALVVAVFGFSGYGTEAMGKVLTEHAGSLWSHEVAAGRRRVGVYFCRLRLTEATSERGDRTVVVQQADVVPLNDKVLKSRLH
ncbi:MAG TPA: hypothetical protein VNE39_23010 [Planctomycetota bacterium]|nr:hypothetical protein [Planctomycetota bacterium]